MSFFKHRVAPLTLTFYLTCCICLLGLCGCSGDALKTVKDSPAATSSQQQDQSDDQAKDATSGSANASGEALASSDANTANAGDTAASTASDDAPATSSEQNAPSASAPSISVSIVVDASAVNRGIFASTTLSLPEGATAFDALRATGLPFGGNSDYVSAINGLAEFDCGGGSGWKYTVNGQTPSLACGSCTLAAGDSVTWYYTDSSY